VHWQAAGPVHQLRAVALSPGLGCTLSLCRARGGLRSVPL
jgi:hypothetical protein